MEDYELLTPLALAFIGDAIHTAYVRKYVLLDEKMSKPNNYHERAKRFCNAKAQKATLERLTLSLEEENIVRRAKNSKPKHTAAHASTEEYSKSTAYEALVGYLYLKDDKARLEEVLKESIKGENL